MKATKKTYIVNGSKVTEDDVNGIKDMIEYNGYAVTFQQTLAFIRKMEKNRLFGHPSYYDAVNHFYRRNRV